MLYKFLNTRFIGWLFCLVHAITCLLDFITFNKFWISLKSFDAELNLLEKIRMEKDRK